MKIDYDKIADAMYFKMREGTIAKTISVNEYVAVDVDAVGQTIGIELLDASSKQGVDLQKNILNGVPIRISENTPVLVS